MQATGTDKYYSAVDLMEIAVKRGAAVWVAYDASLPPPSRLTRQFKPINLSLAIDSRPMKLFFHDRALSEESLTLGSNAENTDIKDCNMYVVFASGEGVQSGNEKKSASSGVAEIRTPKARHAADQRPGNFWRATWLAVFVQNPGHGPKADTVLGRCLACRAQVDSTTGQITGSLKQPGEHVVTLRAKNDLAQPRNSSKS